MQTPSQMVSALIAWWEALSPTDRATNAVPVLQALVDLQAIPGPTPPPTTTGSIAGMPALSQTVMKTHVK